MYEETISLDVAKDGLESFVICMALGTLGSIRDKLLHSGSGTWTLGRPVFWKPLMDANRISSEVLRVLQSADELCVAESLDAAFINDLIAHLERRLLEVAEPCWYAKWRRPRIAHGVD